MHCKSKPTRALHTRFDAKTAAVRQASSSLGAPAASHRFLSGCALSRGNVNTSGDDDDDDDDDADDDDDDDDGDDDDDD